MFVGVIERFSPLHKASGRNLSKIRKYFESEEAARARSAANARLAKRQVADIIPPVRHRDDYTDRAWRKSRLAARILLRKEAGRMTARDHRIAAQLSRDAEVTNRLIQQGFYYLGIGTRKHELDQHLGLVER
jgi:hypothetical protein